MAISDSVQLLSTILGDKRAKNEAAAQRGHETTMQAMSLAQRNLEGQLNRNFQRYENVSNQISNLKTSLSSRGVDVSQFGQESGFSDMVNRIEGSLVEQKDQLENITTAQASELDTLYGAQTAFTQGATFASSTDVLFDQNFNVDPNSEFGAYRKALQDSDELASLMASKGVDLPENPRARQAFIQGASNVFASEDAMLARETARNQALTSRANANAAKLNEANNSAEQLRTRKELESLFRTPVEDLMFGDVLSLANPDLDEDTKQDILNDIGTTISGGTEPFVRQMANMSGVDLDYLEEGSEDSTYWNQVTEAFGEQAMKHVQNLSSNRAAFTGSIERSLRELNRAINDSGSLEDAIKDKSIGAGDLANIFAFVGNPYISDTIGGGFQKLNELNKNMKVREQLTGNKNYDTAVAKANDALEDYSAIEIGDTFRTALSSRMMAIDPNNLGDNDDAESDDDFTASNIDTQRDQKQSSRSIGVQIAKNINEVIRLQNQIERGLSRGRSGNDPEVVSRQNKIKEISRIIQELKEQREEESGISDTERDFMNRYGRIGVR